MTASSRIGDLADITSSKRIYAADYTDAGVPFWRGKEVVESFHGGDSKSELFIAVEKFEMLESKFGAPEPGDVLLTSVGTLGIPYLVKNDDQFYFKDGNLTWFRRLSGIYGQYLFYWIQSRPGKAELAKCTIGTSQQAYTIERLKEMRISLPDLDSQVRVAEVLSRYDDLIGNNRRRIKLLEEAARLIYREWFVRLRFPGHEHTKIENGVPEGWERTPLSTVCFDVREQVNPSKLESATRYVGLEHIPRRSITLNEWGTSDQVTSSKFRFLEGDILFGKIRPYFHKVGFALGDGITSSDAIVIRPTDIGSWAYSLMLLSSDGFVAMASKTVREGSKMPRADWKFLSRQLVIKPSQSVLGEFSELIVPITRQLKCLALQNRQLSTARDLLLPRLMSGEIEV